MLRKSERATSPILSFRMLCAEAELYISIVTCRCLRIQKHTGHAGASFLNTRFVVYPTRVCGQWHLCCSSVKCRCAQVKVDATYKHVW